MNQEIAIRVEKLSKKYTIGKQKDGSLRGSFSKLLSSKTSRSEEFWALQDISFDIQKGDVVGIIGKNGAGKSTLLKILSEITKPTIGRIEINGRVASLLEVGTGFHPELTGRENIYLNGTILGMTRREVKEKFDEIVAFSGVEKFIDTPVKHYSSGMYVRLAFAVAAHLEPEILIIDEVLAVGDAEFQEKCLGKMKDISSHGRTVLFVSHHLGSVRQLCNKGILLNGGKIIIKGGINEVIQEYQKKTSGSNNYFLESSEKDYYIKKTQINSLSSEFYHTDEISLSFEIGLNKKIDNNKFLLVRILDEMEQVLFSCETKLIADKKEYTLIIPNKTLTKGIYKVNCIIYHPAVEQYDNVFPCCEFEILDTIKEFGHLETFDIGKFYITQKWS